MIINNLVVFVNVWSRDLTCSHYVILSLIPFDLIRKRGSHMHGRHVSEIREIWIIKSAFFKVPRKMYKHVPHFVAFCCDLVPVDFIYIFQEYFVITLLGCGNEATLKIWVNISRGFIRNS